MFDEDDKGMQNFFNFLDEDMKDINEKDNKTENKDAKNNRNSLSQSEKNPFFFNNQNKTELLNKKTLRDKKQKKNVTEKSQKEIKEESQKEEEKYDYDDVYTLNTLTGDKTDFYNDFDLSTVEVNISQQSYQCSENQRDEELPEVNKNMSMSEVTKDNTKKK